MVQHSQPYDRCENNIDNTIIDLSASEISVIMYHDYISILANVVIYHAKETIKQDIYLHKLTSLKREISSSASFSIKGKVREGRFGGF